MAEESVLGPLNFRLFTSFFPGFVFFFIVKTLNLERG